MKNTNRLIFAFLAAVALVFAAGCSDDSDSNTISASDLAGTTWTCSFTHDGVTYTMTLKFESDGTVTESMSMSGYDEPMVESYTSYSVSDDGSTVTLYSNGEAKGQYTYSSGQLVTYGEDNVTITYTKKS